MATQNNSESLLHINVRKKPKSTVKNSDCLGYILYDATTSTWVTFFNELTGMPDLPCNPTPSGINASDAGEILCVVINGERSNLAMTEALTKVLIEKGLITEAEFRAKLSAERANYLAVLKRTH